MARPPARAGGTRVLLLDEPLASLDVVLRRELGAEFAALARGSAVVHVAHAPEDLHALADRVIAIEAGRVTESARLGALAADTSTEFVVSFRAPPLATPRVTEAPA